jgi:SpoVK/Ycf46/Vps4 family AAA+-type ATPase
VLYGLSPFPENKRPEMVLLYYCFAMSTARQLIALLKTHVRGDEQEFLSIALEMAAREARVGHTVVADQIRQLVDEARKRNAHFHKKTGSVVVLQPRAELASLVSIQNPDTRLSNMVLPAALETRLRRVLLEHRQRSKLSEHHLRPRRKLLFVGPPGTGKTFTASALAGELHLPLFSILLEGVITKFMGETAAKLRIVFDAIKSDPGVYLFDEFDALGSKRIHSNDVGEIRRVLNSFLQLLEKDDSESVIIAATNHPELLDKALFRRFDDVVEYTLPDQQIAMRIIKCKLAGFKAADLDWEAIAELADGLSQADLSKASEDAAKTAILQGKDIGTEDIASALDERRHATR